MKPRLIINLVVVIVTSLMIVQIRAGLVASRARATSHPAGTTKIAPQRWYFNLPQGLKLLIEPELETGLILPKFRCTPLREPTISAPVLTILEPSSSSSLAALEAKQATSIAKFEIRSISLETPSTSSSADTQAVLKKCFSDPTHRRTKTKRVRKISTTVLGTPKNCLDDYEFDIIQLAIYWVPGFCRLDKKCKPDINPVFSIHGLWPTRIGDYGPQYCCHKKDWQSRWIRFIRLQLKKNWIKCDESKINWWQHEWQKHGTCFKRIPTLDDPKRYFRYSLKQFRKFDIMRHLKNLNIEPKDDKAYITKDIRDALGRITNKKVKLVCEKDISNRRVLTEVRFCYDKQLEYIDCGDDNCPRTVYLPLTY